MPKAINIDEGWWNRPGVKGLGLVAQAALLRLEFLVAERGGSGGRLLDENGKPLDRSGLVAALVAAGATKWDADDAIWKLSEDSFIKADPEGGFALTTAPKTPRKAPVAASPASDALDVIEIPQGLNTQAFRDAWANWLKYRKLRKFPNTPHALKLHLKELAPHSADVAIAMIEQAITREYRGIYPLDAGRQNRGNSPHQGPPPQGRAYDRF